MIAEKYRGIRPAAGYPSCPDHTEKANAVDSCWTRTSAGIRLTESFAMTPAASVSGLYFAHPEATLFRRRSDHARSGRELRRPQGHAARRGGALAGAEPGV